MYATTGTALATNTGCSGTATAGNMLDLKYNFSLGSDNGNPISITNNRVTDRSQTFTYDQLNRIATAQTTATHSSNPTDCWGQAFGFDSTGNWGNLLSISGSSSAYTGCTQGSLSVTVTANNQISSDTYDAAGNLWVIPGTGGATYTNNAENQLVSTSNSSIQYVYDGDGNRVEKTGSKLYWYAGGEILDETDTTGSTTNSSFNEYYFFGGNRIARRDSSSNVFYYLVDHLGTSRVLAEVPSGQTTATLCYDADFEPYGGEHSYTNTCSQNYKFTGKERDSESGLDNFGARYNASTIGRFMTPDPLLNSGHPSNPQTWNRYSYALNNPLKIVDPNGLYNVNCGDDKECKQAAKDLKKGLTDLQKKVDKMKDGPEKQRLEASLKALGTEGDKNNVNVKFGANSDGAAGNTQTVADKTGALSFNVTLDPSKISGGTNYWGIDAAHEGTHVSDISDPRYANLPTSLSDFSLEYRGYQTSAWAAQALGVSPLQYADSNGANVIWNSSWGAADRQTLMDKGITQHVTSIPGHQETTPHNPWPN